jgi:uncharacterized protein (TIGR02246 family)
MRGRLEWRCNMSVLVTALTKEDVTANERLGQQFSQCVLAKDWDGLARLYTEDAALMPPNQPAVEGRANIRAWMAAFPPISEFALVTEEIDGRGDLAFVRGSFKMAFTPPGASAPVRDSGKFLEIHRKHADGSWRIAVDTFNSNQPL